MKKRISVFLGVVAVLAIVVILVWLLFFRPVVIPFTGAKANELSGEITMTALFPVYDRSCEYMTVVIENGSEETAEFGEAWYLEKNVLGSWMDVPRKGDYIVESILRILQPGGKYAFDCRLTSFIGDLENGKYRIVKEINDNTYTAEFEIGESEITLESPFGYDTMLFGYDTERAAADGAYGIVNGERINEDSLISFLEASMIRGLQAQIRIFTSDEEGKLYYTDIVKLKNPVYRVTTWEQTAYDAVHMKVYASSNSNAGRIYADELNAVKPQVGYYASLVTDGKAVWLSAYSDLRNHKPDENDLCIIPEEHVSDSVKDWIKNGFTMQTEELSYSVWNADGSRCAHTRVAPENEENKRQYFISLYNDYGYSTRGYTCGIRNGVFEMNKNGGIREFLWVDGKIVMMRAEDGKGNNYYEFYDTEEEKRLSYTITQNGYRIENGEIIIEE